MNSEQSGVRWRFSYLLLNDSDSIDFKKLKTIAISLFFTTLSFLGHFADAPVIHGSLLVPTFETAPRMATRQGQMTLYSGVFGPISGPSGVVGPD